MSARELAAEVIGFERSIAQVWAAPFEREGALDGVKRVDVAGLEALAPQLAWRRYLASAGVAFNEFSVAQPDFFAAVGRLVAAAKAETLRTYLRWQVVRHTLDFLSDRAVEHDIVLNPLQRVRVTRQEHLWRQCARVTAEAFPDAVGPRYAARRLDQRGQAASEVVGDIGDAYQQVLSGNPWLDGPTREQSIEKVRQIGIRYGKPHAWQVSANIAVDPADHLGNGLEVGRALFARNIARVGQPVADDSSTWAAPLLEPNAAYVPRFHQIQISAPLLQLPFFDPALPAAVNFGAFGSLVGHEFVHSIDAVGRRFDASGRLEPWWSSASVEQFDRRAECVRALYDRYGVQMPWGTRAADSLPVLRVDGQRTLRENLADLGGVKTAYLAFKQWTRTHGASPPSADALTNDQLFFVAFAQISCLSAQSPIDAIVAVLDEHAPPRARVNGTLTNLPEFAAAFGCPEGRRMHPAQRCEVW